MTADAGAIIVAPGDFLSLTRAGIMVFSLVGPLWFRTHEAGQR